MSDNPTRAPGGRFAPGNGGGPGRKGVRNKLGTAFLEALMTSFDEENEKGEQKGLLAIRRTRDEDPAAYVRALTSLMPKELTGEGGSSLITGITVTFVRPEPA